MDILVTGASGFLGRRVCHALSETGSNVIRLDAISSDKEDNTTLLCDLTEMETLSSLLKDRFFDSVIHLAGIRGSRNDMFKLNVQGTANLIDALSNKPGSLVIASSCAVYGIPENSDGLVEEDDNLLPVTSYGQTMLQKEEISRQKCFQRGIPLSCARIFNIFGAEQSSSMMTSAIAQKLVRISRGVAAPPLQTGPLYTVRDLIDVDDVAEAIVLMARMKIPGEFNVGTGIPKSGREIVSVLQEILGMNVPVKTEAEFNPMVESIYADTSRICAELGWKASRSFQSTLTDIAEYWKQQETT